MIKIMSVISSFFLSSFVFSMSKPVIFLSFEPSDSGYYEFARELIIDETKKELTLVKENNNICVGNYESQQINKKGAQRLSVDFKADDENNKGCHNNSFKINIPKISSIQRGRRFSVSVDNILFYGIYGQAKSFVMKRTL